MEFQIFFSAVVVFFSFHGSCQQYVQDDIVRSYESQSSRLPVEKIRTMFDYEKRIMVYKDLIGRRCFLEMMKDAKSKSLKIQPLTKRQMWYLAGPTIIDFCRGFSIVIVEDKNENRLNSDDISRKRRKRSTKHYFKGKVRGQTQSQYLNFGRAEQPGKAEAESTFEGSKAVVSGSSGMGQAQSQSLPLGCEDCFDQYGGPDQEQVIEFGHGRGRYPVGIVQGGTGTGQIGTGTTGLVGRPDQTGRDGQRQVIPGHDGTGQPDVGHNGQGLRPDQSRNGYVGPGGRTQVTPGQQDIGRMGGRGQQGGDIGVQGPQDVDRTYDGQRPGETNGISPERQDQYERPRGPGPDRVNNGGQGHIMIGGPEQEEGHRQTPWSGGAGTQDTYLRPGTLRPDQIPEREQVLVTNGRGPGTNGYGQRFPEGIDQTEQGGLSRNGQGRQQVVPGDTEQGGPVETSRGSTQIGPGGRDQIGTGGPGQGPQQGPGRQTGLGGSEQTRPGTSGGVFGGELAGDYESNLGQRGRFSGKFSGQYEVDRQGVSQQYNQQNGISGGRLPQYTQPAPQGQYPLGSNRQHPSQRPFSTQGTLDERYGGPEGTGSYIPNGQYGGNGNNQYNRSGTNYNPAVQSGRGGTFSGQFSGQYGIGGYLPETTDGTSQYRPNGQYAPHLGGQYGTEGGQYGPHGTSQQSGGGKYGPNRSTQHPGGSEYGSNGGSGGQYGPDANSHYPGGTHYGSDGSTQQPGGGQYRPPGGTQIPGETQYGPHENTQQPGGGQYSPSGGTPTPGGRQYGPNGSGQQPGGDQYGPNGRSQPGGGQYGPNGGSGGVQYGPNGSSQRPGSGQYGPDGSSPLGGGDEYGPWGSPSHPITTQHYPGGYQYGPNESNQRPGGEQYSPYGSSPLPDGGVQYGPRGPPPYPVGTGYPEGTNGHNLYGTGQPFGHGSKQPIIEGSEDDDSDSQVQTSVHQTDNGTQAQAEAQGTYGGGTAQSQVSGTYSGSGSFSASAGSDDGKRGAQTQVSGGKDGARSSAQGRGGLGQTQSQVILSSETGDTISSAQSSGYSHGTQSQVQASEKGGMANAQANAPGSTSSQAQIGFSPYDDNDNETQNIPFKGGGTAGAQSGLHSGLTQAQIQGKFRYGIKYTGGAQAGSGGASVGRNHTFRPGPFKPIDLSSVLSKQEQTQVLSQKRTVNKIQTTEETIADTTVIPTVDDPQNRMDEDIKDYSEETANDYEEDNYDEPAEAPSTKSIITQSTRNQKQHIVLNPLEDLDISVYQSKGDFPSDGTVLQPGETIPGSPGYKIPLGFRGTVKSISNGRNTYAIGKNSQAQSVTVSPGTGRIIYKKPVYQVASNSQYRNGKYSYGSGYTYQPAYQSVQYLLKNGKVLPNFVSVTKSETGSRNVYTGRKNPNIYYSQSSSCGVFTNHCMFNGSKKICSPKLKTNPDGSLVGC